MWRGILMRLVRSLPETRRDAAAESVPATGATRGAVVRTRRAPVVCAAIAAAGLIGGSPWVWGAVDELPDPPASVTQPARPGPAAPPAQAPARRAPPPSDLDEPIPAPPARAWRQATIRASPGCRAGRTIQRIAPGTPSRATGGPGPAGDRGRSHTVARDRARDGDRGAASCRAPGLRDHGHLVRDAGGDGGAVPPHQDRCLWQRPALHRRVCQDQRQAAAGGLLRRPPAHRLAAHRLPRFRSRTARLSGCSKRWSRAHRFAPSAWAQA